MRQRDQGNPNDFKKKIVAKDTPIQQMDKSRVSETSEMSMSLSKSQKSLSQGHSRVVLRSGNATVADRMEELPADVIKLRQEIA